MLPIVFRDEYLVAIHKPSGLLVHRTFLDARERRHGKGAHNRLFQQLFACDRLLLACTELRLIHPVTGLPLTLTAPLAADFSRLLGRLGWDGVVAQRWLPDQHGLPGG